MTWQCRAVIRLDEVQSANVPEEVPAKGDGFLQRVVDFVV